MVNEDYYLRMKKKHYSKHKAIVYEDSQAIA